MDPAPPSGPTSIGRFRIESMLGRGGMGEVYRAVDPTLNRTVALKTLRPDGHSPDSRARLLREAQACARLRHPSIVTVYEAGETPEAVYVVMELLDGQDLSATLGQRRLRLSETLRILDQVLEALAHAHAQDVIHRDIKPSNVFQLPDGSIKLVDFGLARVDTADTMTATGTVMGTPHYASPEQLRATPTDRRTDIYSVGAMAYEMVAGRRPFDAPGATITSVVLRATSEAPPPIDTVWTQEFPALERIILKAMAKSPNDRYQTAAEMRAALQAFASDAGAAIARREAALDSDEADNAAAETRLAPSAVARPSRRPLLVAAAAIVALAAFVAPRLLRPQAQSQAGQPTRASLPDAPQPSTRSASPMAPTLPGQPAATGPLPREAAALRVNDAILPAPAPAPPSPDEAPRPPSAPSAPSLDMAPTAKSLFTAPSGREVPTGLHIRLTRQSPDGALVDVDPAATTFKSGDRVRFGFESNVDGHLYVVQEGTSGRWSVLFPNPAINGGRNDVRKGQEYRIPDDDWFAFDATPGTERVFVFLSREPVSTLPGFDRPLAAPQTLLASVVDDLRGRVQSRDLILEKDLKPGAGRSAAPELTTYVVNRAEASRAVTASLTLTHVP